MTRIRIILTSITLVSLFCTCEKEGDFSKSSGSVDGHDYVDLGLSVKWATCNLGAQKPTDIGEFYAWAETSPHTEWTAANYNIDFAACDTDYVLDAKFDAVTANWGNSWRMPTKEEIDELIDINKCEWIWVDNINGTEISGYQVKSKKMGIVFFSRLGIRT